MSHSVFVDTFPWIWIRVAYLHPFVKQSDRGVEYFYAASVGAMQYVAACLGDLPAARAERAGI